MKAWPALALALVALPGAAAADEQTTRVHIDASPSVSLDRYGANGWTQFCAAPCDRLVPTGELYRLAGQSVMLPLGKAEVSLRVTESNVDAVHVGGYVLIGVGMPAIPIGLLLALLVQLSQDGPCPPEGCEAVTRTVHRVTVGGLTAAGIGAALGIAGIVMITRKGETKVTMSRGAPFTWRF